MGTGPTSASGALGIWQAGWLSGWMSGQPWGVESLIPAAPGMRESLTWGTLVAEGRAAGRDPPRLTFPGSQAGREAAFPVRRRLSPG